MPRSNINDYREGWNAALTAAARTIELRSGLFGGEPLNHNETQIVEHIAAAVAALKK